jgi:hypothetical protein
LLRGWQKKKITSDAHRSSCQYDDDQYKWTWNRTNFQNAVNMPIKCSPTKDKKLITARTSRVSLQTSTLDNGQRKAATGSQKVSITVLTPTECEDSSSLSTSTCNALALTETLLNQYQNSFLVSLPVTYFWLPIFNLNKRVVCYTILDEEYWNLHKWKHFIRLWWKCVTAENNRFKAPVQPLQTTSNFCWLLTAWLSSAGAGCVMYDAETKHKS